jgi:hypothetical protein
MVDAEPVEPSHVGSVHTTAIPGNFVTSTRLALISYLDHGSQLLGPRLTALPRWLGISEDSMNAHGIVHAERAADPVVARAGRGGG